MLHQMEILKKQNLDCSVWLLHLKRHTHTGVKPPQSSSETLPAPGEGRRSCSTISGETVSSWDFPHLAVLVLTYFASSVSKPKVVSLSPHSSWWWRISADKVAQSHCWVCWALSMPGPVPCHHKSLLKIYGYYLSPLYACVHSAHCYTTWLHDDDWYFEWYRLISDDYAQGS